MSPRLDKFESFATHLMLGRSYKRLTVTELRLCREFIRENDHLDINAFAEKVNRWYLDVPERPRHLTDMWALVMQCQSPEFKKRRK